MDNLLLESHYKTVNSEIKSIVNSFTSELIEYINKKYYNKLINLYPYIKTTGELICAYIAYKTKYQRSKQKDKELYKIFAKGFKTSVLNKPLYVKIILNIYPQNNIHFNRGHYETRAYIKQTYSSTRKWPIIMVNTPQILNFDERIIGSIAYKLEDIKSVLTHELTHAIQEQLWQRDENAPHINLIKSMSGINYVSYYMHKDEIDARLNQAYALYQKKKNQTKSSAQKRNFMYRKWRVENVNEEEPNLPEKLERTAKVPLIKKSLEDYTSDNISTKFTNILSDIIVSDLTKDAILSNTYNTLSKALEYFNITKEYKLFFIMRYIFFVYLPQTKFINICKFEDDYIKAKKVFGKSDVELMWKYISAAINTTINEYNSPNFDTVRALEKMREIGKTGEPFKGIQEAKALYDFISSCIMKD